MSIFLDFSKAFDCIEHEVLLRKLFKCGVRGVAYCWFESYLSDRTQYVSINSINSTLNTPDLISSTINLELEIINIWLINNKIKVNHNKSKFILFSYRKNLILPNINLGNNIISETDSTKFLGIIIDKKLNFKAHVNQICKKHLKSIGLLYILHKFLPLEPLKILTTRWSRRISLMVLNLGMVLHSAPLTESLFCKKKQLELFIHYPTMIIQENTLNRHIYLMLPSSTI